MSDSEERQAEIFVATESLPKDISAPRNHRHEICDEELPRPSLLYLATSTFTIGVLMTPIALVARPPWENVAVVRLLMVATLFLPPTLIQFVATFRRSIACASFSALILTLFGVIVSQAVFALTALVFLSGDPDRPLELLFVLLPIAAVLWITSVLNYRWAQQLIDKSVNPSLIRRWALKEIMAIIAGLSAALAFAAPLFR